MRFPFLFCTQQLISCSTFLCACQVFCYLISSYPCAIDYNHLHTIRVIKKQTKTHDLLYALGLILKCIHFKMHTKTKSTQI